MDKKFFTEDDVKNTKDGYVMTEQEMEQMYSRGADFNPNDLPDVDTLVEKIATIMEFITTDSMLTLKKENEDDYKIKAMKQFPEFSDRYYSIFQKVINGDDITPLCRMLEMLQKVKKGNISIDNAEEIVGNELEKEFLHPVLSKKQIDDLQVAKKQLKHKMK
ncbi:MAG: hypothetical protein CMF62_02740 [Magnetococcales bacterium]|nr:hypothetical protein [Magnetococcales bacterium]|tara:strand:- start:40198 stop:40683 length:486 start_codon:yes stop_codon:yes gene_type:complete